MSAPLKSLHLDDGREWRGGQHQVWLLATGLRELGHEPAVMTPPGSLLGARLAEAGVAVLPCDFKGEWDWGAPRAIAGHVAEGGFEIVHAHTAHAHALGVRACRRWRRTNRDRPASLLTTRRVDFAVAGSFFSRRKYLYARQHYIAISEGVAGVLHAGGVPPERIDIVSSGVPPVPEGRALDRAASRASFEIEDGTFAIANVGALTDHKGQRWLIEAAPIVLARHPGARFWIFGEGELRTELQERIDALDLFDRVRLAGHVPGIREKLAGFDLYVSSSHMEGLGTSILDAMLAGVPVVAAEAGGVPDAVRHGKTGWLALPRDAAALARGINAAIETPEEPRRATIEAARNNVLTNFSAEGMVRGNLEVYRRLRSPAG